MPTYVLSEQELINRVLKAEPRLARAAVNAIIASRNALGTRKILSDLILQGRIEEAIAASARAGALSLAGDSAAVYVQSGQATATWLGTVVKITVDFDQVHDFAVDRMRQNRLALIQQWTQNQRDIAHDVISEGIEEGLNPVAQARRFRASTGLTAYQRSIVKNYEAALRRVQDGDRSALNYALRDGRFNPTVERAAKLKTPLTTTQINRMVQRYRERMIKRRAETIARTEALSSVHAGNYDAFGEAVDDQVIRRDQATRSWVDTNDDRTREDHVAAGGQKVAVDDPYIVGGEELMFPGDPSASAEQIINCRCSETWRVTL